MVIGTPLYLCDFCTEGLYASPILVRKTDDRRSLSQFNGSSLAFNDTASQSGFNALKTLLVEENLIDQRGTTFFSDSVLTGSHRASMQAVANGIADMCAVDPVSWALAQRFDAKTKQLQIGRAHV